MSWSTTIGTMEKSGREVFAAVGEAVMKQGVGFAQAMSIASTADCIARAAGGTHVSFSLSGHKNDDGKSGYLSISVSYNTIEPKAEPAVDGPATAG